MKGILLLGRIPLIALLGLCLACNGCSTLKIVPIPKDVTENSLPAVKAGDRVTIALKSGEQKMFRVTAVTPAGIQGKGEDVAYADIAVLEVRKVSAMRTTGAVLGVVTAVGVILIAIAFSVLVGGEEE